MKDSIIIELIRIDSDLMKLIVEFEKAAVNVKSYKQGYSKLEVLIKSIIKFGIYYETQNARGMYKSSIRINKTGEHKY